MKPANSLNCFKQEYVAPICKSYVISIEQCIMSVAREGDNEQTNEEDLF